METEFKGSRLVLRWREVRAMGLSVAWWRARYELKKRLGLLTKPEPIDVETPAAVLAAFTEPPASAEALLAQLRERPAGRMPVDLAAPAAFAETVRNRCDAEAIIAAADQACAHHFELMNQTFDFPGRAINWHFDPPSGSSWESAPWTQVDIRSPRRLGDVKFVWELNRCQFWPTLGRAYQLTGDEKYVIEWVAQFESWCAQNPPEIGVNWGSNLEHALRLVSWWFTAKLMLGSPNMPAETLTKLIGLLIAKCRHIVADLDYSIVNMANNHLIGDAMGLAFVAMALPELREADQWRTMGMRIMAEEARTQIYPDGSSFECAASYHRFVLHFYILTLIMADLNDVEVPADVRGRAEGMASFVAAGIRSDGTLPQYGDWDSGLGYRFNDAPVADFRPVLSTAAVLFGRGDFAAAAGAIDQETIWLLGPDAGATFDALDKPAPAETNRAFYDGGYFFHANPAAGTHLFMQNTPFTSHTHGDQLGLALHLDGRPALIDTGTYTYNGDWNWRTFFRQTAAHNAVTVDGLGQAPAHRAFRWLARPKATTHAHGRDEVFVFDGEHAGYRALGVTHRRIVLELTDRAWLCVDLLTGRGEHDATVHWQVAPDMTAEVENETITCRRDGADVLTLAMAATAPLSVSTTRGETDPIGGWCSSAYGHKEPATSIAASACATTPFCAATTIDAGAGIRAKSIVLNGDEVTVELDGPGGGTTVWYSLAAAKELGTSRAPVGRISHDGGKDRIITAQAAGV